MGSTSDAIPDRLVAALAGRYRIEREIGAGGSATVYLAQDLKHHRQVAIKVLRPQLAAAMGPERFEDEVRIAASLHHPHILALHDSGEADGFVYYVMPYVDGHSLRDRLGEGLLPFPKVAKLLAEVADALAYAHAAGIVHRDIKPENILYSGKHVVVTDFGIAKAISDAAERKSSTSLGIALGTPAYMAPEQASSDPLLDHRADIYSLGVVGYELLVGHPPFAGSAQQILISHLSTKPEPIQSLREAVPPALASIVMRALAKSPDDRWQTAEAMQAQLEPLAGTTSNSGLQATQALPSGPAGPKRGRNFAIASAAVMLLALGVFVLKQLRSPSAAPADVAAVTTPTASRNPAAIPDIAQDHSIAVLPFKNMSSDKEQDYFSDGISEELLNLLAKIPELRVIARTSSFQFRDQDIGIPEIARKLNVSTVLEGSVRKSGDTVRITAQLIRATDGSHLWSETFDRKLDDVFKVQDEIAATVVEKMKLTLLGATPKSRPVDLKVYPLLLQADALFSQGTAESRMQSLKLYQQVVAIEPREGRGWAGLARTYINQATSQEVPQAHGLALVREAAGKALANDPSLGVAHSYLGAAFLLEGKLAEAATEYERGVAVSPGDPRVQSNSARLLSRLGRLEDSYKVYRWFAQHDPASAQSHLNLSLAAYFAGHPAEAKSAIETALTLQPDLPYGHGLLAEAYFALGQPAKALEEAAREADEGTRWDISARALDALGRRAESEAMLQRLIAGYTDDYPTGIAEVYANRGDADRAFEWINRAVAADDPEIGITHTNPSFKPLRRDPRWLPLLSSMGLAPEQLAKIKFEATLPE